MVRATRGRRSGPNTLGADWEVGAGARPASARGPRPSGLGLVLDLALDSAAAQLRRGGRAGVRALVGSGLLHAVLEPAHRAAEVGADIAELLRAEDEQDYQQHDQPMPNAPGTHGVTLSIAF